MNTLAKKWVTHYLSKLQAGPLPLLNPQQLDGSSAANPSAEVFINDPNYYPQMFFLGALGQAQAYREGDWHTDNLTQFLRMQMQYQNNTHRLARFFSTLPQHLYQLLRKITPQTEKPQQLIHAHTDLGNTFFQTFLDERLLYSCGLFNSPEASLEQAQEQSLANIAAQLAPQPSDHILNIGSGWGALAIYLAQQFGCQVTTTTTSARQFEYIRRRLKILDLENKVTLLKQDYRKLQGQFDKLVSIEMLEAVGTGYFDAFFSHCSRLLKPQGLLMIQAITLNDAMIKPAKATLNTLKTTIFPDSALPSLAKIRANVNHTTSLQELSQRDLSHHYVTTLQHWRQRFLDKSTLVKQLGFSEAFIRHWEYYLSYCEAAFAEGYLVDVQLLWRKP